MSLFADAAVEAALLADCHRTQFVGKRRCANYPDAEERGKRVIGLAALLGVVAGDAFTQSTQVLKHCSWHESNKTTEATTLFILG